MNNSTASASAQLGYASGPMREACVNCGAVLAGPYCHECGQVARTHIKLFPDLVREVADDTFGYDSRLWRTLRRLVTSPGFLSREYVLGRRVHYTPPFRLYLVVSLVTFLLLGLSVQVQDLSRPEGAVPELPEPRPLPESAGSGAGGLWADLGAEFARNAQSLSDDPEPMVRNLIGLLPQAMFVLLPLFAALMTPFYRSSGRYYVEHVIFLMHNHAFVFLVFLASLALGWARDILQATWLNATLDLLTTGMWIAAALYVWLAMRRFYSESRLRTTLKYSALALCYLVLLTGAVTLTSLLAIMML